jgi:DNA-binding CsgD family transcriptional regulator
MGHASLFPALHAVYQPVSREGFVDQLLSAVSILLPEAASTLHLTIDCAVVTGDSPQASHHPDGRQPLEVIHRVAVVLSAGDTRAVLEVSRRTPFRTKEIELLRLFEPHLQRAFLNSALLHSSEDTALKLLELTPAEITLRDALATSPLARQSDAHRSALTRREAEVLAWVSEGKRDAEIATILATSTRTVHKHVQRILAKTGADTRTAAVALWRQSGASL